MTIEEIEKILVEFREYCIRHGEYKEMRVRGEAMRPALLTQKFEGTFEMLLDRQEKLKEAIKQYKEQK